MKHIIQFTETSTCYSPFSLMHALLILSYTSSDTSIQEMMAKLNLNRDEMLHLSTMLSSDTSIHLASNIFQRDLSSIRPTFQQ